MKVMLFTDTITGIVVLELHKVPAELAWCEYEKIANKVINKLGDNITWQFK